MPKISLEFDFEDCSKCPHLVHGSTIGDCEGRSTRTVYLCAKGVYGKRNAVYNSYDDGLDSIPKVPPKGCPYINSDPYERLADTFNINVKILKTELDKEGFRLM